MQQSNIQSDQFAQIGRNSLGFKRPGGDITTVLNYTDRDSQDGYFFPLNSDTSWFFRNKDESTIQRCQIMSSTIQEITQRGPASWGQRCTFEIGNVSLGDILTGLILQIRLGHWLPPQILSLLQRGIAKYTDPTPIGYSTPYTYSVSLGTSIIEFAEFEVADHTLEKLPGEYIRAYLNLLNDQNSQFGIATDAVGVAPVLTDISYNNMGMFDPNRPYPTENGVIFCPLPFFFQRHLKQAFPLLSTAKNTIRVHIQFRSFEQCIRSVTGIRSNCQDTPLSKQFHFTRNNESFVVTTSDQPPDFQDCRLLVTSTLCDGGIRSAYLRKPFEQLTDLVQWFHFDEPQKYLVSKTKSSVDQVEIQLPLELNHPMKEIFWVFRRKAVQINNEWGNFRISIESDSQNIIYPSWLLRGTLRFNGLEVIDAEGEFFRHQLCRRHRGGYAAWALQMYGYSFAKVPEDFQPNGTANASRCNNITLNLKVCVPSPAGIASATWQADVNQGWEIFVFCHAYNWIRFENGLCSRLFDS